MRRSKSAARGMFTTHDVSVFRRKSLATSEKRYTPRVGDKELLLSWNTRTRAEAYGDAVASRCKRKAELINRQLRKKKESQNV